MARVFASKTRSPHAMIKKPPYTLQDLWGEHDFPLSTIAQREYDISTLQKECLVTKILFVCHTSVC
jgi:hypothetical protein